MNKRVTIGILETHHKQLSELGEVTGHKITAFVDRAIANLLKDEAPVWRRAAEELQKKPAKR
jgi:hypothetical protein